MLLQLLVLIILKLPDSNSCTNDIYCYICPYTTYDPNYFNVLKLSLNQQKDLDLTKCLPKFISPTFQKKILILNSDSCSDIECPIGYFDTNYSNIAQAFQNESKNSLKYLYSNLSFFLQSGDHYINQADFKVDSIELFRRILVDISIKCIDGLHCNIYLKSNNFFIFISKSFKIQNISFFGNDMNINETYPCYLSKNQICCSELQLNQTFDELDHCAMKGKLVKNIDQDSDYGLFNLEYIFDNPNANNDSPNLIIKDCDFNNIYLLNNKLGFGSLIKLTTYSGRVELNNFTLRNAYFLQSFIYYMNSNYDLYSLILNRLISNQSFLDNLEKLNETIIINNSNFYNINPFSNKNSLAIDNLITLLNYQGVVFIENTQINTVITIPFIIKFSNENDINNKLYLTLTFFKNIYDSSILFIENINILSISTTFLLDSKTTLRPFIQMISINQIIFDNIHFANLNIGFSINCIEITSSFITINNSDFRNNVINAIFYQINDNILLNNCSFFNNTFKDALIIFALGDSLLLKNCYFGNSTGLMSLFYLSSCGVIILESVLVLGSSIYSVFFLKTVNKNLIFDLVALENIMNILWSSDQTCMITTLNTSYFSRNIFGNFFVDFNIPNIILTFENLYLHYNNFISTALIRLYFGNCLLNRLNLIENFFTNNKIFLMVLNFSKGVRSYLNNSYFESNGVTSKKTYYVGFTDNCFVSMGLGVKFTIYDNLTLVASKKVEMVSGFFSGDSHGGLFQLTNSRLIFISINPNFGYKGLYMGDFVRGIVSNNTFFNLVCSNLTKLHMHGSIFLGSSASYIYTKNTRSLIFNNNSFYNCSCNYFAGALAIIGLQNVEMQNCSFVNSSAKRFAGHLLLIAGEIAHLKNIIFHNSTSNEGSVGYFLNIYNLTIENVSLDNAFSKKNGVFFCRRITNLTLRHIQSRNTRSLFNGGFLYFIIGFANLYNITIYDSSASLAGGSIYAHGSSSLAMKNVIIENSIAQTGGALSIENSNNVSIQNCSFILAFANIKGAGIFVNIVKLLWLKDVIIEKNINSDGNGVVLIQTDDENAKIIIKNLSCYNNFAKKGGCIYYFSSTPLIIDVIKIENCRNSPIYTSWSYRVNITISNLDLTNIASESTLVSITSAKISFSNWLIDNNEIKTNLISLSDISGEISKIMIRNNSLFKCIDLYGSYLAISEFLVENDKDFVKKIGFFYSFSSDLILNNGIIRNSYDISLGISSFFEGSTIFENITFENSIGQAIFLSFANIQLKSCNFINNTGYDISKGNDIYFINPIKYEYQINIIDTSFDLFSGFSLNLQGSLILTLTNSQFINFNPTKPSIFAIYAFNFDKFLINSSIFSGFTDSSIKVFTDSFILVDVSIMNVTNSLFTKNKALLGSSVYVSGTVKLYFIQCQFSENYAYILDKNFTNFEGVAPAVFFKPLNSSKSKFSIISCDFYDNIAEYMAPTIFSQMAIISNSLNTFSNNQYLSNLNFTNKIFAFPIHLKAKSYYNNDLNEIIPIDGNQINLISGRSFNLSLHLVDFFGQKLNFDSQTIIVIKSSHNQQISIHNNLAISKKGVIEFNNLIIQSASNTTFSLSFEGELAKITSDLTFVLNHENIQDDISFKIRSCLIGEIILNDTSCIKCKENTYSLIDPMQTEIKYQTCLKCPENAYCLGGSHITPNPGYYRKANTSTNVVPCLNPESCLGYVENMNITDSFIINGVCAPGSYGPICYYCDSIYGRYQNRDPCTICNVIISLVYIRLVLTAIFILLNIIISVSNIENYSKKSSDKDIFSLVSKIIINHSQQLMLVIKNSLNLPDFSAFKNFFNFSEYFSFVNIGSFMNECFLNGFLYTPQKITIYLSLYTAFLPFVTAILAFLLWFLIACSGRFIFKSIFFFEQMKGLKKKIFFKYLIYLLLTAYMFYPMILKSSFTLMDCFKLDNDENITYMRESPEIKCWSSEHFGYICFYGLPGLIVWGISFPVFLYFILRRNYKNNSNNNNQNNNSIVEKKEDSILQIVPLEIQIIGKEIIAENEKFKDEKSKKEKNEPEKITEISKKNKKFTPFSFFYCGYRSKYYYWETFIFLRKFFLTFILTLDQEIKEDYKWLLAFIIFLYALYITYMKLPFKMKFLNNLEIFSLFTCIISVFVSMLAGSNESEILKNFFNIICIGFNLVFYIISALFILRDFYLKVKMKSMKLKEYLTRKKKSIIKGTPQASLKKIVNKKGENTIKNPKIMEIAFKIRPQMFENQNNKND